MAAKPNICARNKHTKSKKNKQFDEHLKQQKKMQAVKLSFADVLKIEGNVEHYHIPKYQREYVWGRSHWETLFNDITENETDYFIGSVIVVGNSTELSND